MKMILFCEKMVIIGPRNNFVLFFAFLVERFNVRASLMGDAILKK